MHLPGISAYYHDAAACLVTDGRIVAAAQEERFSRRKHDAGFPTSAIQSCLRQAGLRPEDIDHVVFYDKPFLKFERLLETYLAFAPRGYRAFAQSLPIWLKDKLFQRRAICQDFGQCLGSGVDWSGRLLFSEHHVSHAASAFFPSPFDEAAVLTLNGVGEWTTTSLAIGRGRQLEVHREIHFPHSLGLLYSAFTYYTGFRVNSDENKVMGLAPYGEPRFADLIRRHLIDIRDDGSYALDLSYFDYCTGSRMTNAKFDRLFGAPARLPESELTQRDMDLAASVQAVTEEVVIKLARGAARMTGQKNLCLAGGVALNCVANGKILKDGSFERIWVQPAAGDAGGAVGAALAVYHGMLGQERVLSGERDAMMGAYLGPAYAQHEIETRLTAVGARFICHDDDELIERTAQALAAGQAVGWHQGRMEFGPRALGGRSILADPRSPQMQRQLNLKVKFRESFRPFAPSVLREDLPAWFDLNVDSPYMLLVTSVAEAIKLPMTAHEQQGFGLDKLRVARSSLPAITHVDYSARIQTVHADTNPRFHRLLSRFKQLTGCPVLVNTSFNVRGEPIVESPEDAFRCLMGTDIDLLAIGNCLVGKADQDVALAVTYHDRHAPD